MILNSEVKRNFNFGGGLKRALKRQLTGVVTSVHAWVCAVARSDCGNFESVIVFVGGTGFVCVEQLGS